MKTILSFTFAFWSAFTVLSAQTDNHNNAWLAQAMDAERGKKFDKAIACLQKIDTSIAFKDTVFLLQYHKVAGVSYMAKKNLPLSGMYFERALSLNLESQSEKTDSVLACLYEEVVKLYKEDHKHLKILNLQERGLVLIKKIYGEGSEKWSLFSINVALAYNLEGDHDKAFQMANHTLSVWVKKNGEANALTSTCLKALTEIEMKRGNEKAALAYVQKNFDIPRKLSPQEERYKVGDYWHEIGNIHYEFDNYDLSIEAYKKAIKPLVERFGKHAQKVIVLYSRIANAYYQKKNYHATIHYSQLAMSIHEKIYGKDSHRLFFQLSTISACQTNLKLFEEAQQTIKKNHYLIGYNPERPNPFEGIKLPLTHLLHCLYFEAKNYFFWYKDNGKEALLEQACQGFDTAIGLIEYIHSGFEASGSKQYLLSRYYYVFEQALNANYELYQCTGDEKVLARALGYAERSRAILLTETLRRSDAGRIAGVPEMFRDSIKQVRKGILQMENRRYELQKADRNAAEVMDINERLYARYEQLRQLETEAAKQSPAYTEGAQLPKPPTPAQIQARLKPGEAWLSYFCGEDDMYAFLVRHDGSHFVHIPKDFPLEQWVDDLRMAVYEYPQQRSDSLLQLYRERAWGLYQKLLSPMAGALPARLTLALDGVLEYLPFEALLYQAAEEGASMNNYPYLLKRHTMAYVPSAILWLKERQPAQHKAQNKVLAFAPEFRDDAMDLAIASRRSSLGPLLHNGTEARRIRRHFRAKVVQGGAATRARFEEMATAYRVLHLATHAKADDENGEFSFLAFSETPDTAASSRLYARDLYAMELNADLVVLSACETGIGELRRGEGTVSLAYGFANAGVRSLVTSLWRVSDRETADLMARFYAGLRSGLSKDEALRQAKLDYLAEQKSLRAHPFFWAAFVPQGDMSPLDMPGTLPVPLFAGVLGVLVAVVFAGRYFRRRAGGA
jgi:CHAT domain-containing protein/tetratricopeptide (TPR) repeat protein